MKSLNIRVERISEISGLVKFKGKELASREVEGYRAIRILIARFDGALSRGERGIFSPDGAIKLLIKHQLSVFPFRPVAIT